MTLAQRNPPVAFGYVEKSVCRSNSLSPANFAFIRQLALRTVIRLSPELPMASEAAFFQENGINFVRAALLHLSGRKINQKIFRFSAPVTRKVRVAPVSLHR
jgi:hypothetical protein